MRCRWSEGFSLVEALTALAIVALLVSLAVPSFSSTRREAALTASVNQLLGALHFARSAAILSNTPTVVCLSARGQCADRSVGESIQGWLVFRNEDRDSSATLNGSDALLRQSDLPEDISIRASRTALTFWPTARAGTTGTFTLCSRSRPFSARKIVVSQTGRPRVAESEASECAS